MSLIENPDEFDAPRASGTSIRSNPSGIRSAGPDSEPPAAPARRGTTLTAAPEPSGTTPPDPEATAARPPRRSATPGVAAMLSLAFPGVGQLFAGAIRRGLLLTLPTVVLILVVAMALGSGMKALLGQLVQPGVVLGIVAVNGIYAIYHLFAIADAWFIARRARPRTSDGRSAAVLAVALVVAVGLHGLVGAVGVQAYQTVSAVIANPGGGIEIPDPGATAGPTPEPGATTAPTPTPGPAYAADGRLNLLLVGADSGPGRWLLRTDTMILLSVDIATGQAALFGIPRNLYNVPLAAEDSKAFPDGVYPDLLNSLWVYAIQHPKVFPGGNCADQDSCDEARGFRALTGAVQALVGVPLDGAVVVNLNGFVDLVNAVAPNGIWIRTEAIHDDAYPMEDGSGHVVLNISAGCHNLDGHLLLAYARSRHQDSDYGRMARQQQVLVTLLHQLDPIGLLPHVSDLLTIAKDNLTLAIPSADLGSLASLAASVDQSTVQRIGFDPPEWPEYLTAREIRDIHNVVRRVFADAVASASPSPSGSAAPGPTARPCPGPNVSPSATASP